MKIQCACGAKFSFEVTPGMAEAGMTFVCPSCGLDSSEAVTRLVRQELEKLPVIPTPGETAAGTAEAAGSARAVSHPIRVQLPASALPEPEPVQRCSRHPAETATATCCVCSKPICPRCLELFGYLCSPLCKAKASSHGLAVPVYKNQKALVEARKWRLTVWGLSAAAVLAFGAVGFWIWYSWFGSRPQPLYSVRFPEPAYSGQSAFGGKLGNQLVFLHGGTLARHDLAAGKPAWSVDLIDKTQIQQQVQKRLKSTRELIDKANSEGWEDVPRMPDPEKLARRMEREAAGELELHVRGENIWVVFPERLVRYEWLTGKRVQEIPVPNGSGNLLVNGDELLLLDQDRDQPRVQRLNLVNCETRTEEIRYLGSRPARAASSGTLAGLPTGTPGKDARKPLDPGKVAAQAQRMSLPERIALPATIGNALNQERMLNEMDEGTGPDQQPPPGQPDSVSLIPTPRGFVQLSIRTLERKTAERTAMKPRPAKSAMDGDVSVANTLEIANELLNEMQRERGGEFVREDISRYRVAVRHPGAETEFVAEVTGPPKIYPLESVTVVAANKLILVIDKQGKKLWESPLSHDIRRGLEAMNPENAPYGQGPCVERSGRLYVFDEGMLTAFDLAEGKARWRLPSVGVVGLFFDQRGDLYVNTSSASPESLKYSRQIDISQKVSSVVMKVDADKGKVIWSVEPGGLVNHVYGNVVLTVQFYRPDEDEEESPYKVDTGFETPPYLKIRRINSRNGADMWEHFQQRAPLDIAFDRNTIRLVFKKEVQVLKFMKL